MKKIAIILCIITLHASAKGQELTCLDKLLPFNRNSGLHQVTKSEWNEGKEILDAEIARAALLFLTDSKLLCKTNEVQLRIYPTCSNIIADIHQSNTCFVFTNVGYFTITRDHAKNINFIFTRDKSYAEPSESSL